MLSSGCHRTWREVSPKNRSCSVATRSTLRIGPTHVNSGLSQYVDPARQRTIHTSHDDCVHPVAGQLVQVGCYSVQQAHQEVAELFPLAAGEVLEQVLLEGRSLFSSSRSRVTRPSATMRSMRWVMATEAKPRRLAMVPGQSW